MKIFDNAVDKALGTSVKVLQIISYIHTLAKELKSTQEAVIQLSSQLQVHAEAISSLYKANNMVAKAMKSNPVDDLRVGDHPKPGSEKPN